MAHYTIQLHSLSGSFASPWGNDVRHASSLSKVHGLLEDWADAHCTVGAEATDAHALVWYGEHEDVTDLYPDFELTIGPRGGIHRQLC